MIHRFICFNPQVSEDTTCNILELVFTKHSKGKFQTQPKSIRKTYTSVGRLQENADGLGGSRGNTIPWGTRLTTNTAVSTPVILLLQGPPLLGVLFPPLHFLTPLLHPTWSLESRTEGIYSLTSLTFQVHVHGADSFS